ncbi:MAG: DUF1223 domain-containing protein [Pseudomonadota bacterium]
MTSKSPPNRRQVLAGGIASAMMLGAGKLTRPAQASVQTSQSKYPVVVELFTSQGCSSCPPADALLGQLAERADVVSLAYHVDYWDRLGWKDPFSSSWATELQTGYSRRHRRRNNYTPQMIVDGEVDVIGSRRKSVMKTVEDQLAKAAHEPRVIVDLTPGGDRRGDLRGNPGDDRIAVDLSGMTENVEAEVLLLRFDKQHRTQIGRGENRGRTLDYHHVVRERRVLGRWRGEAIGFRVPPPAEPNSGLAVLVQERNFGPIIGAGQLLFKQSA